MHPWRTNPNRAWSERKWRRCVTSDNGPVMLYNVRLKILFPFASQQREKIIYDHFSDPVFINQFIEFLSLEDRKGKDKFSPRRFCLFKVGFVGVGVAKQKMLQVGEKKSFSSLFQGLFRNFNDAFIPLLQPHMERLVADTHESKQRCVSEIISGLIRGCKHWSYLKACVNSPYATGCKYK